MDNLGRTQSLDFAAILVRETEMAWLLDVDLGAIPGARVWMPKSVAEFDGETLTCPEWLAIEKGL